MFKIVKNALPFIKTYLYRQLNKPLDGPLIVYITVTEGCNLRCKFCEVRQITGKDRLTKLKGEMSFSEMSRLIKELGRCGVKLIHLTGGEPLTRPDIVEIVKEIKKNNMTATITTNGALLSQSLARDLVKAGTNLFFISLDSADEKEHDFYRGVKGTFRKVIEGAKYVKMYGGRVMFNSVITRKNYKKAIALIKLAKNLGVDGISFMPIISHLPNFAEDLLFRTEDEINELEKTIHEIINFLSKSSFSTLSNEFFLHFPDFYRKKAPKLKCYAGYGICKIDSVGNVFACNTFNEIIGNVKKESFSKIWKSKKFEKVRKKVDRCKENCWRKSYMEINLRFSLAYQLKHLSKTIHELKWL